MSEQFLNARRARLKFLSDRLKLMPARVVAYNLIDRPPVAAHTVCPRFETRVYCHEPGLSGTVSAVPTAPEPLPQVHALSAGLDSVPARFLDPACTAPRVVAAEVSFPSPPVVAWHPLRRPSETPAYRVHSMPLSGGFPLHVRAYPIPLDLPPGPRTAPVKALGKNTGGMRPFVRSLGVTLRSAVIDGTGLSERWRVRRRSWDVYRMPIDMWQAYVNEILRQKGLRATDIELLGVFPIPNGGLQDLTLDLERGCLFYRFAGNAGRGLSMQTLLVARDKSTGALHKVIDRGGRPLSK